MTGESHDVGARLRELVIAGELAPLRAYLDGLTGADLRAARTWVAGTHDVDEYPYPDELGDYEYVESSDGTRGARVDVGRPARERAMHRARCLTRGRLLGPVAAVQAVSTGWGGSSPAGDDEVVAAFVDHDEAWVTAFARAADAVSPSARNAGLVTWLLRKVVEAHGLPVPTGRLFHEAWIKQVQSQVEPPQWSDRRPDLDPLRADPLLPDVVYLLLASGEVGVWPGFARVLPTLVDEGVIDRDRTLAVALEQLTAGQKPSSQKALAGVLTALGLRAEEVPGGLDYLMGVLTSCHGYAAGVILRLALDLVASDPDAVALARALAPRREKGLRRTLLTALSPAALGDRVSREGLVEAIDVLASGDEDVADVARYDKARAALGVAARSTGSAQQAAPRLGLWNLTPPTLAELPRVRHIATIRDVVKPLMRTDDKSWEQAQAVEMALDALARGDLTTSDLAGIAHELVAEGRLSPARSASLFEALFLGGAMQLVWPAAMHTADLAASGARVVPGLDRLLAMLSSYGAEPPPPVLVPTHVARISRGTSKAALEARRLLELVDATPDGSPPARIDLGLWDESTEHPPQATHYQPKRNLDSVARRLAATQGQDAYVADPRGRIRQSLMLEELVALIPEHGVDEVRARGSVGLVHRTWPMAQAVAVWAAGLLDTTSYWRMAEDAESVADKSDEWKGQRDAHLDWRAVEGVREDPPVMPWGWRESDWQLEFLHACEVLLLGERGGTPLSTPDRVDGALSLDALLERLARARTVGPIDLRLALARLRPTTPGDAARVPGHARTEPALTVRTGDHDLDASELVRSWLAGGGLQCTVGLNDDGHPVVRATSPWSWNSLPVLARREVPDLPPIRHDDIWRLPARPDVWLRGGFHSSTSPESLADVGGRLGADGWRRLFEHLAEVPPDYTALDFAALVRLQRQGRLDPAVATATAVAEWDGGRTDLLGDVVGWEHVFLRGALRGMWPVAVAVVEAGLARPERPGGIDALRDVLRRYAHHVPGDTVPAWLERNA